jgi:O-acetyl-ADP-ribose deacetylase (regulator of RNase III)
MIEFTSGDILKDEADAIVNTVNCVGIMGRGIALQFKNAWPENFKAYEAACKREEVQPGRMFVYEVGQLTRRATSSTSRPSGTGAARAASKTSSRA